MKSNILTAIDIGTSAIMGVSARRDPKTGEVEILGKSLCPCLGVRCGEVSKPEYVAGAIRQIVDDLSAQSGYKIREAMTGVSGNHLFVVPSNGLISVSRADQRISQEDVNRVISAARAIQLPFNKEIMEVIPRDFVVDGEAGIKNPAGLNGLRLEVKTLLVCNFLPAYENLLKAFSGAGVHLMGAMPSPLAASRAVLSQEQKELGVILMDVGAGTTSVAIFEKGDLKDFAILPLGSANITNDIALGLRTEIQTAEQIKQAFATLDIDKKDKKPIISLPENSLSFTKKFLQGIVQARVGEIFSETERYLRKAVSQNQLPCGIVLTGGGSNLPGVVEFAKENFKLPCRLGTIKNFADLKGGEYAVCAGLLLSGFEPEEQNHYVQQERTRRSIVDKIKGIVHSFLP